MIQRYGLDPVYGTRIVPDPEGAFVRVSDLIEALEESDLGDFVAAILEMKEPVKPADEPPVVSDMPEQVDVDGIEDANGIRYFGKATRQPDGTYSCLANVCGGLALVSVRITRLEGEPREMSP